MTLREIELLLDYHYWARDRALEAASALTPEQFTREFVSSFASVRDTLVHTYSAEWVWYSRWLGESPAKGLALDMFADVVSLRSAWAALEVKVRRFVSGQGDAGLQNTMHYTLLNGKSGASVLWQMVQHVVNHASYHRGQITTLIRQAGGPPPKSMDLIAFYREHP